MDEKQELRKDIIFYEIIENNESCDYALRIGARIKKRKLKDKLVELIKNKNVKKG